MKEVWIVRVTIRKEDIIGVPRALYRDQEYPQEDLARHAAMNEAARYAVSPDDGEGRVLSVSLLKSPRDEIYVESVWPK